MCNTCFNLDFHKPKKDQCEVCTDLKNLTPQLKKKLEEKYKTYQKQKKNVACEIKANETLPTQEDQASINPFFNELGIIHLICVRNRDQKCQFFRKCCVPTKWMTPYGNNSLLARGKLGYHRLGYHS